MASEASGSSSKDVADEFLPGFPSFEDYSQALFTQLITATKSANRLPQEGDDFDYYISFPGYQTFSSKMAARVDRLISRIIRHQQLPCYWGVGEEGGAMEDAQLEEKFESLIEANDVLLERASMLLDEVSGLRRNVDQPVMAGGVQQGTAEVATWNSKHDSQKQMGKFKFISSRNVPRPQVRFQDKIDNSNNPFIPRLSTKCNARVPLPDVYEKLTNPNSLSALIANAKEWAGSEERLTHPYKFELENLEPLPRQLEMKEPQMAGSLEDTPLTFVDTLAKLEALKEDLMGVAEFAIDLEHHSYRSFLGFTCLMQISTRFHDYLIDTLEVRHHMHLLLDPFTNPAIIKVMHGAEFDMHWMQRDFGLYVVNLFDTGQASRVLELPKFSLAFLLHYCCEVEADKQYQLADWRIRPLPQEMVKYAREDTHYLLYVYDRMRNELIRRGNTLLKAVLDQSREVCLRQYQKPIFSENDYLKLYMKHKRRFNSQQLHCLQLLYTWRDHLAREEDESPGYVLPNHMLFQIAEILPREAGGVLACCNPIPILLRQQQQEVFLLVRKARDTPLTDVLPTFPKKEKRNKGNKEGQSSSSGQGGISGQGGVSGSVLGQGNVSGQRASTDDVDMLEVEDKEVDSVHVTGPPVQEAEPVITALKSAAKPGLPKSVVKKLKDVQLSLPDILSQFQEAKVMTPAEVLIQQQLAYEAVSLSTRAPPTDPAATPTSSANRQESKVTNAGKRNGKKVLSVREMGKGHFDTPVPSKKPRPSEGVALEAGDFQPFEYQGSSYTQYAKGRNKPVEAYDPNVSSGRDSAGKFPSASRSRVQQKTGQRSQTYTPHGSGKRARRPSWTKHK